MKENERKCYKCGCSPAQDPSISLHRFPKPGRTNSLKCELWAKYCFPHDSWSSPEFQSKLHSMHLMLCMKHFKKSSFIDSSGKRLIKSAAPDVEYDKIMSAGPNLEQPQVLPAVGTTNTMPLCEMKNIIADHNVFEPVAGPSNINDPLCENMNLNVNPVAVANPPANKIKDKRMLIKMKNHMRKIKRLQNTIKHLKNEAFLNVLSKNHSINEILKCKISSSFALLLQGELQNYKRKPKGRRWDLDSRIIALRLFKRSPRCYKLLRRMICLPTPSSLKTLLYKFNMSVGINDQIFNVLKKSIKEQTPSENLFILMFDEMSIRKNLFYNKKEDIIEGYQDHALQGRSPEMATHALVFMIGGIRKKVKQPIAYYFSSGFVTADRLSVLMKEVLQHCFDAGINISATVCDMDGVNKRALSILGASVERPYIMINNREVVTIFDTPHLLKCFRNMFLKYDIKCATNVTSNDHIGFGVAKWSHIKDFYDIDSSNPNFVFAPSLKQEHLNPNTKQKMKVKLAAQVLSHSVAAGMYAKISQGDLSSEAVTTANVIANMDKLFDSVNACTPDLRRGKPFSTNLKNTTKHLQHFTYMKCFFNDLKFLGCKRAPPSLEGWIWTINGIERIWKTLSSTFKTIKSLETRRLQQDPLENLFGCIRANCGCNSNPTAGQFVAGLKTAVLSNLSFIGTGNCEDDENEVILRNFKTLLSPLHSTPSTDIHTAYATTSNELDENINPTFECSLEESSGEIQACAYVCGFIIKNNHNKCEICKNIFVSETQERFHYFIEFKEYDEIKKSLKYASINLIKCVESGATLINGVLETEAYKKNIKGTIKISFINSLDFEFLDKCPAHKEINKNYLFDSIFHICVKRFCILKNRQFASEYSASALKRKIDILKNK